MRREDFMRQLERLLEGVAEEEKQEALSYYQSYFEDAGEENEERILKELESPEKVAATIKADLGMDGSSGVGEYTERGFEDSRFVQKNPIDLRKNITGGRDRQGSSRAEDSDSQGTGADSYQGQPRAGHNDNYSQGASAGGYQSQSSSGSGYSYSQGTSAGGYQSQSGSNSSYSYSQGGSTGDGYRSRPEGQGTGRGYGRSSNSGDGRSTYSGRTGTEILMIVAIAIVTSPVWLGAAAGIAGGLFGLAVSAVCVAGSLFIAGFVLVGVGIGQMAAGSLAIGFALSGAGLLLLALAVLATILCIWVCGKLVPWVLRLIGKLWNSIFSGKEKRA